MEKIRVSNKELIFAIAGIIYEFHPYHKPENIDKIIDEVIKWLNNKTDINGNKNSNFKIFEFNSFNDLKKELDFVLKNIIEFRQLNISKALKEIGVKDCDDERNAGIKFTSRYDEDTEYYKYYDFIDLDACINQIVRTIDLRQQITEDCFLCKYSEKYGSTNPSNNEICNTCLCNPKIKYNYVPHPMSLKLRNQFTEEEKKLYNID